MEAGIPYICSDFPKWKEIIDKYNCGVYVNPSNLKEIANAIEFLLTNSEKAEQMGKNGKDAISNIFNWKSEENKIIACYNTVLGL